MEEFNPWWRGEEDRDIEEFSKLNFKYYPKWLNKISLTPFSLNFVFGLRKVGKTTGIKLLIRELLKRENPFSIFFLRADIFENYKELYEAIREYWKMKEEKKIKKAFIFIDEVTLVEDWWRAIKVFIDEYKPRAAFILSGSVSMFFYGRAETFSGRKGKGKIIEVTPLSFSEYFNLFNRPKLKESVKEIFKNYLETGGYLGVLNKVINEDDIILGIKGDIKLVDKSTSIAKQIFSSILRKAPSALSYRSIASDLGISVKTVIDYVELFEKMFLIKIIEHKGLDGRVYPRKEKKIILRDPFLAKSISLWTREKLRKDFLYEWIVQEHLYRKYGEIYYYKNKYEIDCIASKVKVEVKAGKPHRRYPKGVKVLDEEEIPFFLLNL